MIKVSVIIPVYNVELYLPECLSSIFSQSMTDFEVICVDDASTDTSAEILKKFEKENPSCMHTIRCDKNKGQANARNIGLKRSVGKYIYFMDADDMLKNNALQRLCALMQQNDVELICFDADVIYESIDANRAGSYNGQRKFTCPSIVTGKEFFLQSIKSDDWQRSVWRQFWLHEYLEKNHLKFWDDSSPHEDGLFSLRAIWGVKRLLCIADKLYTYRRRNHLIMTSGFTTKRFMSRFIVYVEELLFLRNQAIQPNAELMEAIQYFLEEEQRRVNGYWKRTFSNDGQLPICYFNDVVYQSFYKDMYANLCSNLMQLDKFLDSHSEICLYGTGRMSELFYRYLELKKCVSKLSLYIVSDVSYMSIRTRHQIPLIDIDEYQNKYLDKFIFVAVGEQYHQAIKNELERRGIYFYVLLTNSLWSKISSYVHANQEKEFLKHLKDSSHYATWREDILLLAPPYWDAFSPFSAIPSLVAALKKSGIHVHQIDLGIECFHTLLRNNWEKTACFFLSEQYYQNKVVPYKNNPYKNWDDYTRSLWFFQGTMFPFEKVKTEYFTLNIIQRGVLVDFFTKLLETDSVAINFNNQSETIQQYIRDKSWYNLIETLNQEWLCKKLSVIPKIVGIAATGRMQFLSACKLAELIKLYSPSTRCVLGGSCADLFMSSLYINKTDIFNYFDYVIVGEGETALHKLYRHIAYQDVTLDNIPNLCYMNSVGKIIKTFDFLEDVENLPLADYSDLNLKQYVSPRVILPYQASRGCHYGQCAFCNHDEKYRHNYRMKSAYKVVNEIRELSRLYRVLDFQFVDEAIRPDHFTTIVNLMNTHDEFKYITWFYYSRVSRQYTTEILNKAYNNGCRMVMFGVETFIQRLLKFIRKGISAKTSIYTIKAFHAAHIKTFAWMLSNLPSETVQELEQDIDILEENIEYLDGFHPTQFRLEINTDMYSEPSKYNIITIDTPLNGKFTSYNGDVTIDRDHLSSVYYSRYISLETKHFFSTNRYVIYFGD